MSRYAIRQLWLLASICCVLSQNSARADEAPAFHLKHRSLYHSEPIAKAHRIEIFGSIQNGQGEGTIRFDGNKCFLNEFGDVEGQTAVNFLRQNVKFTRIEAKDNFKRDREIYEVTGGLRRGLKLRLVVDPKTSPSTFRLVIIEDDKPTVLALITSEYAKDYEYSAPSLSPRLKPKATKSPDSATTPEVSE